jgi:small conductance mechanosensitive channel
LTHYVFYSVPPPPSTVKIVLYVLLFLLAVETLGLPTGPLLTALGSAGLAVSLAVKDSLSNVASGMSILSTKPFTVGDFVEIGNVSGTVKEVGFVHTVPAHHDNTHVYIPTARWYRTPSLTTPLKPPVRLDLNFSVGYQTTLKRRLRLSVI